MRKKLILDTKNKKGITLVSLVVTIIVLLILAGITINLIIGEDGIIKRAQQAGKNYIDAAENEKLQLGQFTNEMDNIISGSTNSGRVQYNSTFRKNVVEAIKNAGVATTESDTDETIVANIGKILKEKTKDATATADNISAGKTAWVNGELITGNGADNSINEVQSRKKIRYKTYTASGTDATIKGYVYDDVEVFWLGYQMSGSSTDFLKLATLSYNSNVFKWSLKLVNNSLVNNEPYDAGYVFTWKFNEWVDFTIIDNS